jgi:hypothetical protein
MGHGVRGKSIIYALVLAIGMSLLFPEGVFSASRSFRRSGKSRGPAVHSRHGFESSFRSGFGVELGRVQGVHRFRDPFDRSGFQSRVGGGLGFIGGHVIDAGDVVIIQVTSSAPNPSREPAQTGTYVDAQWVDGGHGVEILRPGYWSDAKQRVER